MRRAAFALPLLAICLAQGCVAVLVPAAATGLATRRQMRARQGVQPVPRQASADAPPPPAVQAGTLDAVPADPATMQPGKLYRGALPGPPPAYPPSDVAVAPGLAPPASPGPAAGPMAGGAANDDPARPATDWNDLSRYVAEQFVQSPSSVLLMPGTTLAAPRWLPCGDRPVAVLVDLEAVVPPAGGVSPKVAGVLGAVETLQITVVYVTRRGDRALAAAVAAVSTAGLHPPEAGRTLFPVAPDRDAAVRATIGARYCVVAIAGDRAEDFPNRATPATAGDRWNRGWFLLPDAGRNAR